MKPEDSTQRNGRARRLLLAVLIAALTMPHAAAAQHFGRNKVPYRTFDFRVLRTPHFDIHFYPEERQAALDAARMAEQAYQYLSRVLDHQFQERKPILLYGSHAAFQQTNALPIFIDEGTGGVTEPIKDRVIVPFTGSYAEFEHVLTHELVHAFQFDVLASAHEGARTMTLPLPLWYMEGMAEYLSIGHIDAHTAAWVRDAVLTGYMRDIREMSARDDYLSYRFGQSLWAYIGSRWGDAVIGKLLQRTSTSGIESAFKSTLGVSLGHLSADWLRAVRLEYLPPLVDLRLPASVATRLTDHARLRDPWYLAPALSPDGRLLVYLSQRGEDNFSLWLADAHTGKPLRRLLESERNAGVESLRFLTSSAAFSRNGRFLAFSALMHGRDVLYVYDLRKARTVHRFRFDLDAISSPTWSPDGDRIAFSGMSSGLSDLFLTDLTGHLTRLTHDRYADLLPAWSPDGTRIAFSTDREAGPGLAELIGGELRVALYDVATGAIQALPGQAGKNLNPVWSPDGRSLAWISDRSGTSDLYLFDTQAAQLHRLTDFVSAITGVTPLSPALTWAADGRLVFVYFERAGYNLYAIADPLRLAYLLLPQAGAQPGLAQRSSNLPDTSDFQVRRYDGKLEPDELAASGAGVGLSGTSGLVAAGSSSVTFSDLLGNRNLALGAYVNGALADGIVYAGYTLLGRRPNMTVSAQQVPYYTLLPALSSTAAPGQDQTIAYVRETFRTGSLGLNYAVSQFRRLELSLAAGAVSRTLFSTTYRASGERPDQTSRRLAGGTYAQAAAALVFDNASFGWTGPISGRRYRLQVVRATGQYAYTEFHVDARQYGRPFRPITVSARFTGLVRQGDDAGLASFYWGGPYFLRGYNWGSFDPNGAECRVGATPANGGLSPCPARDRLTGSSVILTGGEVRFPLGGPVPLGDAGMLPPLEGAAFVDAGLAWSDGVCTATGTLPYMPCPAGQSRPITIALRERGRDPYFVRTPAVSYGLGIRANVGFGILRLDYAIPLERPRRRGVASLAFGPAF